MRDLLGIWLNLVIHCTLANSEAQVLSLDIHFYWKLFLLNAFNICGHFIYIYIYIYIYNLPSTVFLLHGGFECSAVLLLLLKSSSKEPAWYLLYVVCLRQWFQMLGNDVSKLITLIKTLVTIFVNLCLAFCGLLNDFNFWHKLSLISSSVLFNSCLPCLTLKML